jgi:hypothetical protein
MSLNVYLTANTYTAVAAVAAAVSLSPASLYIHLHTESALNKLYAAPVDMHKKVFAK